MVDRVVGSERGVPLTRTDSALLLPDLGAFARTKRMASVLTRSAQFDPRSETGSVQTGAAKQYLFACREYFRGYPSLLLASKSRCRGGQLTGLHAATKTSAHDRMVPDREQQKSKSPLGRAARTKKSKGV
jgi:hypothetical protein